MTPRALGLLHTVPALAGRFETLAAELAPGSRLVHLADPSLLATAIADGVTAELAERVAARLSYLAGLDVDAVLATCSSIGDCVDEAASRMTVPVLRVDRPMAAESVRRADGGRVAVLATLISTLEPTRRLVTSEARTAGVRVQADAQVVEGAAEARSAGDSERHDALVREAVARAAAAADVVVLAQASMADAVSGIDVGPTPVLSSPLSGLRAALATPEESPRETPRRGVSR